MSTCLLSWTAPAPWPAERWSRPTGGRPCHPLLGPDDQLNVVVYDHEVDTVLERMPATSAAKKQALAALGRIDARGQTDLAEGWSTGARALGRANPDDRVRRVLLLTDGLANRGLTDAASLREAAARLRAEGIGTSTFGVGNDFDEELLTSIAADGGGHFYFIEQPAQIPDFFASESVKCSMWSLGTSCSKWPPDPASASRC